MAAGRLELRVEEGEFALAGHQAFLDANAASIGAFRARQAAAFAAERDAWEAAGEFARAEAAASPAAGAGTADVTVPEGGSAVEAEFPASVWQVAVRPGDRVRAGQRLLALEAMKMESPVEAPVDGVVDAVLVTPGTRSTPARCCSRCAPGSPPCCACLRCSTPGRPAFPTGRRRSPATGTPARAGRTPPRDHPTGHTRRTHLTPGATPTP